MSELSDTYERYCDDMQSAGLGAEAMDYEGWLEWNYRNLELAYCDNTHAAIKWSAKLAAAQAKNARLRAALVEIAEYQTKPSEGVYLLVKRQAIMDSLQAIAKAALRKAGEVE